MKHGLILKHLECFCVSLEFFLPSLRGTNWWIWWDELWAAGEAQPRKVEMKTLVSRLRVACHQRSGKYNTWWRNIQETIRQDVFMSSELLCSDEQLPLRVWWCTPAELLPRAGGGRCRSARTGWCGSDGNEAPDEAGRGTSAVWSQTHRSSLSGFICQILEKTRRKEKSGVHLPSVDDLRVTGPVPVERDSCSWTWTQNRSEGEAAVDSFTVRPSELFTAQTGKNWHLSSEVQREKVKFCRIWHRGRLRVLLSVRFLSQSLTELFDELTCDPEAVRSAGARQDVRRRLVVIEQTLPLREVVVSEEIQRVCRRETRAK